MHLKNKNVKKNKTVGKVQVLHETGGMLKRGKEYSYGISGMFSLILTRAMSSEYEWSWE